MLIGRCGFPQFYCDSPDKQAPAAFDLRELHGPIGALAVILNRPIRSSNRKNTIKPDLYFDTVKPLRAKTYASLRADLAARFPFEN